MGNLWRTQPYGSQRIPLPVFHHSITNAYLSRIDNGPFERIKKKSPIQVSPSSPSWTLASATPGTQVFVQTGLQLCGALTMFSIQVEVIPPPPAPGLGCEVNRVPAVFTWHIIPRLD